MKKKQKIEEKYHKSCQQQQQWNQSILIGYTTINNLQRKFIHKCWNDTSFGFKLIRIFFFSVLLFYCYRWKRNPILNMENKRMKWIQEAIYIYVHITFEQKLGKTLKKVALNIWWHSMIAILFEKKKKKEKRKPNLDFETVVI